MAKRGTCVQRCRFGSNIEARPLLTPQEAKQFNHTKDLHGTRILTKRNGNCFYLVNGRCSIYNDRPRYCREFDCTKQQITIVKTNFLLRVLLEGFKHKQGTS